MYKAPDAPRKPVDLLEEVLVLYVAGFRRCWPVSLLFGGLSAIVGGAFLIDAMEAVASAADPVIAFRALNTPLRGVAKLGIGAAGIVASLTIVAILLRVSRGDESSEESLARLTRRSLPAALLATCVVFAAGSVGLLVFVVPGVFVIIRLVLWPVALLDERAGASTALRRSWNLTAGHWWHVFGVLMLTGFGLAVFALIVASTVRAFAPPLADDVRTHVVVVQATTGLLQAIGLPLMNAALVVLYRDLQLRSNGTAAPEGVTLAR